MKRGNVWKIRLSALLMVVMMFNMTFTAFARWKEDKENGVWYYEDENGKLVVDEVRYFDGEGRWYAFDENGRMRTGWIELDEGKFFAFESGALASRKWALIDGEWYYFDEISKENGELKGGFVSSTWIEEEKGEGEEKERKVYYLGPDGKMAHGRFIYEDELTKDFKGRLYYALETGELAQGWYKISDEGKVCDHGDESCGCSWYRFKGLDVENGKLKGGAFMDIEEKVGNEGYFLFDSDGKMIVRDWCENDDDKHFYLSDGFRAVDRWLPIGAFWYHFDADGKIDKYAKIPEGEGDPVVTASSSNAPARTVASIEAAANTVNVVVGETADINFNVNLASDSNAKSQGLTKDHDMRVVSTAGGSIKGGVQIENAKDGTCKVSFTAGLAEKSGKLTIYIDDVKSDSVTVNTTLSVKNDEVKTEDVNNALDKIFESKDSAEKAEGLKKLYTTDDDTIKEAVQQKLLNNEKELKDLDDSYAEANRITREDPAVSEDVKDLVGDVTISGSALNAEPGDTVQLNVDKPSDEWTSEKILETIPEGNYEKTVAIDIKLLITKATGDPEAKTNLDVPVVITMKLPEGGFTEDNLQLFNIHDDGVFTVAFKILSGGRIQFVTDRFSTYVFAQKPEETEKPGNTGSGNSGGSGGGGRSSGMSGSSSANSYAMSGSWQLTDGVWKFLKTDGSPATSTWGFINGQYYYFDAAGNMVTGWYEVNGKWYYMNPQEGLAVPQGAMLTGWLMDPAYNAWFLLTSNGDMMTGWQEVGGKWYYLNPVADGTQGAMAADTYVDGYYVGADGAWVQ